MGQNRPTIQIMEPYCPSDTLPVLSHDKCPHAHAISVSVLSGPDAGLCRTFPLSTVQVGRATTADLVLRDPTVSMFHLELSPYRSGVRFADIRSRNGISISGILVEKGIAPSGCKLQLGTTEIRVELEQPFPIPTASVDRFGKLIGGSLPMRQLYAQLARLAPTPLSVLIQGETGVGKELIAHALHANSPRTKHQFVVLDCSTMQPELAASKLFGHEKGAFTGAAEKRMGVFEAATQGTVFLDEIGELSIEIQKMLLRALEANEVIPLGSHTARKIDVRVLAASHKDLRTLVNRGLFREDLYYRLAQATVQIPSLGERKDDIPQLVQHFLSELPSGDKCARRIAADALVMIQNRPLPGNVRQLRNWVRKLAYLANGPVITCQDLSAERESVREGSPLPAGTEPTAIPAGQEAYRDYKTAKQRAIDGFEREFLIGLMRSAKSISSAAIHAGIERHSLRQLLKKHSLYSPEVGDT